MITQKHLYFFFSSSRGRFVSNKPFRSTKPKLTWGKALFLCTILKLELSFKENQSSQPLRLTKSIVLTLSKEKRTLNIFY